MKFKDFEIIAIPEIITKTKCECGGDLTTRPSGKRFATIFQCLKCNNRYILKLVKFPEEKEKNYEKFS